MDGSLIVFSDLDGCLLNHEDYSYEAARPVLTCLWSANIPLVLCSSKTEAEMRPLAEELRASETIICENGGVVCWNKQGDRTVLGADRDEIVSLLQDCKQRYQFSSFTDLDITGIAEATGLPDEKARLSAQRFCTEPLLWEDDEQKIEAFRRELETRQLRLTRGGRFWHVSGETDKGRGAATVFERFAPDMAPPVHSIALGDSGIDQPMLEWAETAVIIPAPDGTARLNFDHPRKLVASKPGSAGWAECMSQLLDEFNA